MLSRTVRSCCFLSRRTLPVKHDAVSKLVSILNEQIAQKRIIGDTQLINCPGDGAFGIHTRFVFQEDPSLRWTVIQSRTSGGDHLKLGHTDDHRVQPGPRHVGHHFFRCRDRFDYSGFSNQLLQL